MEDKKYPGFDVNPIFPVYEYLNLTTTLKLCEAGFGSFIKLQSTPLDLIKLQASLSESEDRVPGRGVRVAQEVMDSGMVGMPIRRSRRTG